MEELSGGLTTSPRRSRAESYDERALKQFQNPIRVSHHHIQQQSLPVDPTWELHLKGEQTIDVVSEEETNVLVNRRGSQRLFRDAGVGMPLSGWM